MANGLRREFVLGTISPLTPATLYYARLDCGGIRVPFLLRTQSCGVPVSYEIRLPVATSVRYGSDAAFSAPVVLPEAKRQLVPVAGGSVVYVQIGSQAPSTITGR